MPHWEFAQNGPIDLLTKLAAGSITVTAEPTEKIIVDVRPIPSGSRGNEYADEVHVDYADGRLEVIEASGWRIIDVSLEFVIIVPAGSHCTAETASASITCRGEFGSLTAESASGAVKAATITGEADVSCVSGRVTIGSAATAKVKTASGSVEIGQVSGDVNAQTVSGRVQLRRPGGSVIARSSSGRVDIAGLSAGEARIETISGEVRLDVVRGVTVYLDLSSLSGKVRSDLEPSGEDGSDATDHADLHLTCRTVSGAIRVGRTTADLAS
jgi:hypothetical protein